MKPPAIIVPRIAAAAAEGFESALRRKAPRTPRQWVEHCRAAATVASEAVRRDPPLTGQSETSSRDVLAGWVEEVEDLPAGTLGGREPVTGRELEEATRRAASAAFRSAMPLITSKGATRAYIACIAAGTQDGVFTGPESKTLAYTAQLALAAWRKPSK